MPPSARTSPPSNPPPTLSNPIPFPLNTRANSIRNGPMRQPSAPANRPGMDRRISEEQISPKSSSHTKSSSIPNLNAALPPIVPHNQPPNQNFNPSSIPNPNDYQIGNPYAPSPPKQKQNPKPSYPPVNTNFRNPSLSEQQNAYSATQPTIPTLYPSGYPMPAPTGSLSRSSPDRPRIGTARTASEPRGPTSKYSSPRSDRGAPGSSVRGRLFMETIPAHASEGELPDDEYPDELYDLYRNTAYSNPYTTNPSIGSSSGAPRRPSSKTRSGEAREARTNRSRERSRPRGNVAGASADEEGGVSPSGTTHSSLDDFEILNDAGGTLSRPRGESRVRTTSRARTSSRSRHPLSGSSNASGFPPAPSASHPGKASHAHPHPAERRDDIRTIRVKLHSGDDTRYLMVSTTISFEEFLARVREKLGLRGGFKVRIRDEGDLITMGDRDDWEMAVAGARKAAREGGGEMGRLDVWVVEVV